MEFNFELFIENSYNPNTADTFKECPFYQISDMVEENIQLERELKTEIDTIQAHANMKSKINSNITDIIMYKIMYDKRR